MAEFAAVAVRCGREGRGDLRRSLCRGLARALQANAKGLHSRLQGGLGQCSVVATSHILCE